MKTARRLDNRLQRESSYHVNHQRAVDSIQSYKNDAIKSNKKTTTRDWTHFNRLQSQLENSSDSVATIRSYAKDAKSTRDWTHFNRLVSNLEKEGVL